MAQPGTGIEHYQRLGEGYADRRRPDPRIAAQILRALGDARTVLNVGAGTGSYEPEGRRVIALEPSPVMLSQRTNRHPCVRGVAGSLPFTDGSFDAAMGVLTIHHWPDWQAGLRELLRVAKRVVLLTYDTGAGDVFWLMDYFPAILEADRPRMPAIGALIEMMGGYAEPVPVPHDCIDGFLGAYWREPAVYLDPDARQSMSGFAMLTGDELASGLGRLEADLSSGEWERRNGGLRELDAFDIGYRLVVSGKP